MFCLPFEEIRGRTFEPQYAADKHGSHASNSLGSTIGVAHTLERLRSCGNLEGLCFFPSIDIGPNLGMWALSDEVATCCFLR